MAASPTCNGSGSVGTVRRRRGGVPRNAYPQTNYTPVDSDVGQQLRATVTYTDGHGSGKSAQSGATDAVVGTNTAPVISGPASKSVDENTRSVATYSATDAEGDHISWSLGGTDEEAFSTFEVYGTLWLEFDPAPDYESPDDSGRNNAYNVTVTATDDGEPKKTSQRSVTVTVDDVSEPPDAPSGVSVSAPDNMGHERLEVSWTAPDNSGRPALSGYDVNYCKTNEVFLCDSYGIWSSQTAGGTSTLLTGLSSNTGYTVRVRARNDEGTSGWSSRATGRTHSAAAKALAEQLAETGLEGLAALAAPNPFNPSTTIYFQVTESEEVSLVVYSLAGQVGEDAHAGPHPDRRDTRGGLGGTRRPGPPGSRRHLLLPPHRR